MPGRPSKACGWSSSCTRWNIQSCGQHVSSYLRLEVHTPALSHGRLDSVAVCVHVNDEYGRAKPLQLMLRDASGGVCLDCTQLQFDVYTICLQICWSPCEARLHAARPWTSHSLLRVVQWPRTCSSGKDEAAVGRVCHCAVKVRHTRAVGVEVHCVETALVQQDVS